MFEKWRIKQHMEVTDSAGQHVGTVDEIEDNRIKLTRSDSADASHHYLDLDAVDKIDDNRVYLKAGTPLPFASSGANATGAGNAATTVGADVSSAAAYGGSAPSADLPGEEDKPLFGTSGHGTGVGGSGVV